MVKSCFYATGCGGKTVELLGMVYVLEEFPAFCGRCWPTGLASAAGGALLKMRAGDKS
jgi:hypothetical protein